jgi:sulfur-carrier protein
MQVKVRLFTTLADHTAGVEAGQTFTAVLPEGSKISSLIKHLHLPEAEAKIIMVNGRARDADFPLKNNDEVAMFPPIGGG